MVPVYVSSWEVEAEQVSATIDIVSLSWCSNLKRIEKKKARKYVMWDLTVRFGSLKLGM